MALLLANLIAIVVLGILVLRRGSDPRIKSSTPARVLRIVACIILGIPLVVFLIFGIGEMVGGDLSGGMHLVEALVGILAWKRPFEAGIILCLSSLALGGFFLINLLADHVREGPINFHSLLILVLPTLITGILFLSAGIMARRAQ